MKKKIRTAIFPVAGLGTRFLPATKAIPKEMLVVGEKPLIQHAVEEAKAAGIERFIFVTSQGKSAIEDHFDVNRALESTLISRNKHAEYALLKTTEIGSGDAIFIRQQQPLGLGHAVSCAKKLIGDEPFALLLADDIIIDQQPCLKQLIDAFETYGRGNYAAVMEVPLDHVTRYGILDVSTRQGSTIKANSVVEKPHPAQSPSQTAIVGRYILDPRIFSAIAREQEDLKVEIQLTDAFNPLIKDGIPFYGVYFEGQRFDCGTKEGWLEANFTYAFKDETLKSQLDIIVKRLYPNI